jgi:hypothetical protein
MELVLVCGQATSAGSCTPPAHQPSRTRRRSARTGTARRGALRHRHARTQCPPAGRRRSGAMSEPHTGPWRGRRPPPCARPWCTPLGLARWPSPRQAAPRTATNSSAARLLAAPSDGCPGTSPQLSVAATPLLRRDDDGRHQLLHSRLSHADQQQLERPAQSAGGSIEI